MWQQCNTAAKNKILTTETYTRHNLAQHNPQGVYIKAAVFESSVAAMLVAVEEINFAGTPANQSPAPSPGSKASLLCMLRKGMYLRISVLDTKRTARAQHNQCYRLGA
jgi:hypothetical protein